MVCSKRSYYSFTSLRPINENCNSIFHAGNNYRQLSWGALDDVVMGGVSESTFQIDPSGGENGGPTGVFKGMCQILANPCDCTFGILGFLVLCFTAQNNTIVCLVQVLFQRQIMVALRVLEQR